MHSLFRLKVCAWYVEVGCQAYLYVLGILARRAVFFSSTHKVDSTSKYARPVAYWRAVYTQTIHEMAQQPPPAEEQEEQLSSFFPSPPPFFKHFTVANLKLLEEAKANAAAEQDDAGQSVSADSPLPHLSAAQLLALPAEVRYLIPPEPPAEDEEYTVFQQVTKLRGDDEFDHIVEWIGTMLWNEQTDQGLLKDWKYEQLYPSPSASWSSLDRQHFLFRFLRSIIRAFVELLGIMAADATSEHKDKKLKHILTLVLNMHALINEYRPHQARETLIGLMEQQVEKKRAEVEGVKKMADKVRETLEGFEKDAPKEIGQVAETAPGLDLYSDTTQREKQREMWLAMDEILGH
jgi:mediator of RNA polymerase II transcription subunit 7